jgi:hypothetical protein
MQGEARKGEAYQALEKYLQSRDQMPDIEVSGNLPEDADGMFTSNKIGIGSGTIKIRKDSPKATLSSLLSHEMTHAADRQMMQQAMEQGMFGDSNQYTEAYEKLVGKEGRNRTELARDQRPEWAENNRYYRASPKEIAAYGVGAFAGPTSQRPGPRHVDATAATELQILMDLAQRNVDKRQDMQRVGKWSQPLRNLKRQAARPLSIPIFAVKVRLPGDWRRCGGT